MAFLLPSKEDQFWKIVRFSKFSSHNFSWENSQSENFIDGDSVYVGFCEVKKFYWKKREKKTNFQQKLKSKSKIFFNSQKRSRKSEQKSISGDIFLVPKQQNNEKSSIKK